MPLSRNPHNHSILGIDPGTKRIGYGVLQITGQEIKFVEAGLLIPRIAGPVPKNLLWQKIRVAMTGLVKKHHPELIAIERVYFGQNISSAFAVSEVRGALLFMIQELCLPAIDVHPTNVKQVVCGYGHADKTAVRKMIFRLVSGIPKSLTSRDAIDALAIALTGYYAHRGETLIDNSQKTGTTDTG